MSLFYSLQTKIQIFSLYSINIDIVCGGGISMENFPSHLLSFFFLYFAIWQFSFHQGRQCLLEWPQDLGIPMSAALIIFCVMKVTVLSMSPSVMADEIIAFNIKVVQLALSKMYQGFLLVVWLRSWNDRNKGK